MNLDDELARRHREREKAEAAAAAELQTVEADLVRARADLVAQLPEVVRIAQSIRPAGGLLATTRKGGLFDGMNQRRLDYTGEQGWPVFAGYFLTDTAMFLMADGATAPYNFAKPPRRNSGDVSLWTSSTERELERHRKAQRSTHILRDRNFETTFERGELHLHYTPANEYEAPGVDSWPAMERLTRFLEYLPRGQVQPL